ncbi:MAG TPA: HAD family hydrolase [Saprospiraceae bacterium]|nr:HAD family hydrolase [Saprospiraceae bacterium]HNT21607.1 HAD family hydrolase [Saprospiraceae bacterium]
MTKKKKTGKALFLDRDGVINRRLPGDYVKTWKEFDFLPGTLRALGLLRPYFDRILVVTNQQGIGKGKMTEADLANIHRNMKKVIRKSGGHIDRVYHCPDLESRQANCRKPNPDMGKWAKADFPEIDFDRSVMVGDTDMDLLFGKNLGMTTILIAASPAGSKDLAEHSFRDLMDFYLNFVKK